MSVARYFPHYRVPTGTALDPAASQWLAECRGDAPLGLVAVADLCATICVEATLLDAAGRVVGHVDSDGSWRLMS
jgi:hypothetical protein